MADDQDVTLWKYLSGESQAGRLDLDPSISKDCLTDCENELAVYREARRLLLQLSHVSGLGDLPAADELSKMFGLKAIGGDGDFDSSLAKHIEVLELIRDTIKYSVDRLVDHDQAQAAAISKQG